MISMNWKGKVAVITGGATGIGLALARQFAREGMDIVLSSRSEERLEKAAAQLREGGSRVLTVPCDVANRSEVYALSESAWEFGEVGVLCANAGATSAGPLLEHLDEDWDWALDVNLRGSTNCVQAFYPDMAARHTGTILLTGSQTSLAPDWIVEHGPYVAAKAGVLALATCLRAEAKEHGVNVSILIPAATTTEIGVAARRVPNSENALKARVGGASILSGAPFWVSPEEVAERAVAGLRDNAPIIVTHWGMKPLVEEYFRRILSAYDEAAHFKSNCEV